MGVGRARRELELIRSSVGVRSMSMRSFGEPVTTGGGPAGITGGGVAAIGAGTAVIGAGVAATDGAVGAGADGCTGEVVVCATGAAPIAGAAGSGCVWQVSRGSRAAGNEVS